MAIDAFPASSRAWRHQDDATSQTLNFDRIVSTDPPYYDNIGYADLSDFFYVWLRRSLRPVFPDLFATLAVPKAEELVATPVSSRQQGEGRDVLPRRHDPGDAPARRAGASGLPGHHLLRLQTVGERRRRRHGEYWLGNIS